MSDDLEELFNSALGSDDGSDSDLGDDISQNADINMGDDESDVESDLTDDDADVSDSDEVVDNDDEDDTDDGATDESGFDWATVKDQKVTIKVDGQETDVTLEELRNGYMRQSDYTRKTQGIAELQRAAEWAVQMQQAFKQDPQGTLEYLARATGVNLGSASEDDPYNDIDPELQPIAASLREQERRLSQMQAAIAAQAEAAEQERYVQEAQKELWEAQQEFPDMDVRKTLELAAEKGVAIREAHLLLQAETLLRERQAAAEAAAKAERIAKKNEAKRRAAGKTLKGSSAAGKPSNADPSFDSFEDMLMYEMSKSR